MNAYIKTQRQKIMSGQGIELGLSVTVLMVYYWTTQKKVFTNTRTVFLNKDKEKKRTNNIDNYIHYTSVRKIMSGPGRTRVVCNRSDAVLMSYSEQNIRPLNNAVFNYLNKERERERERENNHNKYT